MTTSQLLGQAGTQLVEWRRDTRSVITRAELTRQLIRDYADYHDIRLHLFHGQEFPQLRLSHRHPVMQQLTDRQWIQAAPQGTWKLSNITDDEETYLRGGWLEELLWLAHQEVGVDELHLGAKVEWEVQGVTGNNEIDVLARRGKTLSFTSCKCVRPISQGTPESLRQFILEANYWNTHFANGHGRAVVAVTADIFDERRQRRRYPPVHARAAIVDVDLLGLEDMSWEKLVAELDQHWS